MWLAVLWMACAIENEIQSCPGVGELVAPDGVALSFRYDPALACDAPLRVVVHADHESAADVPEELFTDADLRGDAVLIYDRRGFGASEGEAGDPDADVADLAMVVAAGRASGARTVMVFGSTEAGQIVLDQASTADASSVPDRLALLYGSPLVEENHAVVACTRPLFVASHWQNGSSSDWTDAVSSVACEAQQADPSYRGCMRASYSNAGSTVDDTVGVKLFRDPTFRDILAMGVERFDENDAL